MMNVYGSLTIISQPVGRSGTRFILACGFFNSFIVASAISLRLYGGTSVDKVQPIPEVPFNRIIGNLDGSVNGSYTPASDVSLMFTLLSNSEKRTSFAKSDNVIPIIYLGAA